MERLAVDNLPNGTLEKLKKKAMAGGFKHINGTPNLSAYLRGLIEKVTSVK